MKKILIIEDEEITSMALEELVISLGYEVTDCVNNALDALKSAKENKPDLIISDIMIQGAVSGCEVSKEIYRDYNIPIIFLTAYFDDDILEYAKESNPFAYIIKPYKDKEIEATLKLAFHKNISNNYKDIVKNGKINIGNYFYDQDEKKLFLENTHITISKKSLKLLDLLSKHQNNTVSYEILINYIYGDDKNNSLDNLRHIVKRLKQKLQIDDIKSVKNIGYVLKSS